ncbi:MAG: phosphoribosyltransferase family protein [Candidatus Nanopelagicales bacterium]
MRFVDLADGGRRLAALLAGTLDERTLVVSIGAGGRTTGAAVGEVLGVHVVHLETVRTDDGVQVEVALDVTGREVVVVDDGVETGTAARAVASALRAAGASRVVLAVPVCPREAEADLRLRFDDVVAVDRPLVRRSLRWHYETFA